MNSIDERFKSNNDVSTSNPSIVCRGVTAFNYTNKIIYWTIYTMDGTRLYTSEPQYIGYNFMLDLTTLGVKNWTELVLAAIAPDGTIIMSDIIMQVYSRTSNIAYFECLEISGSFVVQQSGVLDYIIVNNEVTITGYTGLDSILVIPETIEYLPVTAIDSFVFHENAILKSINTTNVKTIGDFTFASCHLLESVTMPKVETLSKYMFYDCLNLNNVDLPLVNFVGSNCFEGCTALETIYLPSVITIADFVFYQSCIKYVDIPIVESIDTQSFSHCEYLENLNISKNLATVGDNVFLSSKVKNICIDYGTEDITNVGLEDWNTIVNMLTELDLSSVTGKYVKNNLLFKDLVYFTFYSDNGDTLTATKYTGSLSIINIPGYIMEKEVIAIGDNVFAEHGNITSVTMTNVTTVGYESFAHCAYLKAIVANNLKSVGYDAFIYCSSLESITSASITFIDNFGFAYCSKLTSIELRNISGISDAAFYCGNLQKLVISKNAVTDGDPFKLCPISTITIYYGSEDISTVTINDWNNFVKSLALNPSEIPGKYVMNDYETIDFSDKTPPIITLLGNNPMKLEVNNPYIEPGAVVTDNVDTGLQAVITGSVDTTKLGSNSIHYNATDLSGNKATEVIRTVNIIDTIAPVITLNGKNPMSVEVNTAYTEPGAIVTDNVDTGLQAIITGTVDTTELGLNTIHYNATDLSGNKATEVIRTVNVVDTIVPVITLLGDNPMSVEINGSYHEPGATVTDNVDTGLQAVITGSVNTIKLGSNTIHYNATDLSGNKATEVIRTVNVIDTIAPVITLIGDNPMTVEANTSYVEPGAIVTDNIDTDLQVIITGSIDTSIQGEYLVYYNAVDSSGNKATEVVRTVNVIDTTIPVIILNGSNPMAVEINTPYIEPGAIVVDDVDENLQPVITGAVDSKTAGQYYIYYNATDSSGNKATEVCRLVTVADTTPPIIILNGDYRVYLSINNSYVEEGAVVTDNVDTDLQPVITGYVDVTIAGEYDVYYNATDSSGNKASEVMRTVYVSDPLDDFCYTINNNEVIITCYRGVKPNVIIPETIEGLPVTTIDSYTFASSIDVLSINTSKVTTINDFAFKYCQFLSIIIMPEVKVIEEYGLASCKKLRYVSLPKVTNINTMAFANCVSLKSINISSDLSFIGTEIFSGSTLENIIIDYGTEDITKINIYDWNEFVSKLTGWDLTTVPGKYAKNNLYTKDLVNNLTYKEYSSYLKLVDYYGTVTDLKIPEAINLKPVTAIDNYVFEHASSLKSINMPSVTTIGRYAFFGSANLTSIIGNKVTTLGVSSIQGCGKLTNLTLPELTTIDQGSLAYLVSLTSISFPKLATINGEAAFASCTMLKSIDLPNLTVTGDYTFPGCINLTDFNIPSVITIGTGMFALCIELQEVDLSKVSKINDYAFYECTSLNKVIVSKDATTGTWVFIGCPIINVTIYYEDEDISTVTIDDWNAFVTNMGLVPDTIPGKYVMNDYGIRELID